MFKAYVDRGANDNELDNKAMASRMAVLRVERANLLGYETHADYVLEKNMAKTPQAVYDFLNRLWTPALARAKDEAADMQEMIRGRRRRLRARALGLVVLRGEGQEGQVRPRRGGAAALLQAGERPRRRLHGRRQAVRDHLRRALRHPQIPRGRPGVRGQGRRRLPSGRPVRRLLPARLQAGRGLDEQLPRTVDPRRQGHPSGHRQQRQLLEADGRGKPALHQLRGGPDPVPRVRPRPPRHPGPLEVREPLGHQRGPRFRRARAPRSWRTGPPIPKS